MQGRLFSIVLMLLAGLNGPASADTMYKCVDAKGKIAYSGAPCHGTSREAKSFEVAAPLDNQTLAAAEVERLAKLAEMKAALAQRRAERVGPAGRAHPPPPGATPERPDVRQARLDRQFALDRARRAYQREQAQQRDPRHSSR